MPSQRDIASGLAKNSSWRCSCVVAAPAESRRASPAYATSSTSTRLFFVWPSKRLSTNSDNHVVLGLADTCGLHFMDGYLIAILVSDYLLTFLCTDEE